MHQRQHLPLWAKILLDDKRPKENRRLSAGSHSDEETLMAGGATPRGCLILIAHGSKDPRWRGTFECLYESVKARFGDHVKLAYMEFVGPTLMEVAAEAHREGFRRVRVLPLFMAGGAHVATDIPEQVEQVRTAYPDMNVDVSAPIGEDPRVFAVLQEIIGDHSYLADQAAKFDAA